MKIIFFSFFWAQLHRCLELQVYLSLAWTTTESDLKKHPHLLLIFSSPTRDGTGKPIINFSWRRPGQEPGRLIIISAAERRDGKQILIWRRSSRDGIGKFNYWFLHLLLGSRVVEWVGASNWRKFWLIGGSFSNLATSIFIWFQMVFRSFRLVFDHFPRFSIVSVIFGNF